VSDEEESVEGVVEEASAEGVVETSAEQNNTTVQPQEE